MPDVKENVSAVWKTIRKACEKSNRNPEEIQVVAVSKGFGKELIQEAVRSGMLNFGENYIQEALPKQEALKSEPISWHFTGHLQRNKAALAGGRFHLIQSLDSLSLAEALQKSSETLGQGIACLIQIKVRPETGYGVSIEDFPEFLRKAMQFPGLRLQGLMAMAPPVRNSEEARPYFQEARRVFETARKSYPESIQELSMGMSDDYPVAIEEGATMVRLGRAIFGERPGNLSEI